MATVPPGGENTGRDGTRPAGVAEPLPYWLRWPSQD